MTDIIKIADEAQMIINDYAFTEKKFGISAINLNTGSSCVITDEDSVIETDMDDIELDIVTDYYARNKKYMEYKDA